MICKKILQFDLRLCQKVYTRSKYIINFTEDQLVARVD